MTKWKHWPDLALVLGAASMISVKTLVFHLLLPMTFSPVKVFVSSFAVAALLGSPIVMAGPRVRRWLLVILSLAVSGVLLADLWFQRFFHTIIPWRVAAQASQAGGVGHSIVHLAQARDALLFVDAMLLGLALWRIRIRESSTTLKQRGVTAATVILAGCVVFGAVSAQVASAEGTRAFSSLHTTRTLLQQMGVLSFHLVDAAQQMRPGSGGKLPTDELLAWQDIRRRMTPNDLHGIAKGKNLIVVQLEAFQDFLVGRSVSGQEITPTLNRLKQSSFYFPNYYPQISIGNTSDAEFASLNSLYPLPDASVYRERAGNQFRSLPTLLKELGCETHAFHGFEPEYWNRVNMYRAEGFDQYHAMPDYVVDEAFGMGITDRSFFQQTISKLKSTPQPFMAYTVTLSGHHPYTIPPEHATLNIAAGTFSQMFTDYLQAQHYADLALGEFIAGLESEGILNNSVLAIYGDHFGQGWTPEDVKKLTGLDPSQPLDSVTLNKVPLFIRLPGGKPSGEKPITGGQIDLTPTLANVLGIERDRYFPLGQDLLNNTDGFVAFRHYLLDGSFVDENRVFIAHESGQWLRGACLDRKTGNYLDVNDCKGGIDRALWAVGVSDTILKSNGIPLLVPKP